MQFIIKLSLQVFQGSGIGEVMNGYEIGCMREFLVFVWRPPILLTKFWIRYWHLCFAPNSLSSIYLPKSPSPKISEGVIHSHLILLKLSPRKFQLKIGTFSPNISTTYRTKFRETKLPKKFSAENFCPPKILSAEILSDTTKKIKQLGGSPVSVPEWTYPAQTYQ